jgi:hypothetical protein
VNFFGSDEKLMPSLLTVTSRENRDDGLLVLAGRSHCTNVGLMYVSLVSSLPTLHVAPVRAKKFVPVT